jgi:hypothetical protein
MHPPLGWEVRASQEHHLRLLSTRDAPGSPGLGASFQSASVQGGGGLVLMPPHHQHSKSSGTRYFWVHQETTGSPQTTHSVPHQPQMKRKSTGLLPATSVTLLRTPWPMR